MSVPPAKRPRTEESELPEQPQIKRSKHIWFDDGNVVLQVESTQFRVHRSILAAQSSVFRDMFAVPQPAGTEADYVEGCPLVHMYGDTAGDWRSVLAVLYRSTSLDQKCPSVLILTGLARLGKKYQFDALRREACNAFTGQFPDTLEAFDHLFSRNDYSSFATWIMSNLRGILRLADEMEIQSVLPVTYYVALSSDYEQYNGTAIYADARISAKHLRALMRGRTMLAEATTEYRFNWMLYHTTLDQPIPTEKCDNRPLCTTTRIVMVSIVLKMAHYADAALDPWKAIFPEDCLCFRCRPAAMKLVEEGRQHIWQHLPQYFLGMDWDDLDASDD